MIPEVHACSGYLVITAPNGRIATTPEPWVPLTHSIDSIGMLERTSTSSAAVRCPVLVGLEEKYRKGGGSAHRKPCMAWTKAPATKGSAVAGPIGVAQLGNPGHDRAEVPQDPADRLGSGRVRADTIRRELKAFRGLLDQPRNVPALVGLHRQRGQDRLADGLDEFLGGPDGPFWICLDGAFHPRDLACQVVGVSDWRGPFYLSDGARDGQPASAGEHRAARDLGNGGKLVTVVLEVLVVDPHQFLDRFRLAADHRVDRLGKKPQKLLVVSSKQSEAGVVEHPVVVPVFRVVHAMLPDITGSIPEAPIIRRKRRQVIQASEEVGFLQPSRPVHPAHRQLIDDRQTSYL